MNTQNIKKTERYTVKSHVYFNAHSINLYKDIRVGTISFRKCLGFLFTYRHGNGTIEYKLCIDRDINFNEFNAMIHIYADMLKVKTVDLMNLHTVENCGTLDTPYFTVTNGKIVLSVEI